MEASPRQSIKLAIQIQAAKAAPTRQRIIFIETYSTIVTCGEPGLLNDAFCCASQNPYCPQKSCCANNFSNVFGKTFIPAVAAPTSLNVSTTTIERPASAACPSTHPTSSSHVSHSTIVTGVKVGTPHSVILLSTLCVLLYREPKHRSELQRFSSEEPWGRRQAGEEGERIMRLGFVNSVP